MGAGFGFLGLAVAVLLIFVLLANQNSFGVPMLSMRSLKTSAAGPLWWQKPLWKQEKRPDEVKAKRKWQEPRVSRVWANEQGEGEEG